MRLRLLYITHLLRYPCVILTLLLGQPLATFADTLGPDKEVTAESRTKQHLDVSRKPTATTSAISRVTVEHGTLLKLSLDGFTVSNAGTTISGPGLAAGLLCSVAPRWAIGGGLAQTFDAGNRFQAVFTSFDLKAYWAPIGSFIRRRDSVAGASGSLTDVSIPVQSTLSIGVGFTQYLFYGSSATIPLSGGSAGITYDFPLANRTSLFVQVGADLIVGSGTSLTPIRAGVGLLYWP